MKPEHREFLMSLGGKLEKRRKSRAEKRTRAGSEQLIEEKYPSSYMPEVPRAVHKDGGAVDPRMQFLQQLNAGGEVEDRPHFSGADESGSRVTSSNYGGNSMAEARAADRESVSGYSSGSGWSPSGGDGGRDSSPSISSGRDSSPSFGGGGGRDSSLSFGPSLGFGSNIGAPAAADFTKSQSSIGNEQADEMGPFGFGSKTSVGDALVADVLGGGNAQATMPAGISNAASSPMTPGYTSSGVTAMRMAANAPSSEKSASTEYNLKKLGELDPVSGVQAQTILNRLMDEGNSPTLGRYSTGRTFGEQAYLKANAGPHLTAAPGKSFHNYGLAMDVHNLGEEGYKDLSRIAAEEGWGWGGSQDPAHVQKGRWGAGAQQTAAQLGADQYTGTPRQEFAEVGNMSLGNAAAVPAAVGSALVDKAQNLVRSIDTDALKSTASEYGSKALEKIAEFGDWERAALSAAAAKAQQLGQGIYSGVMQNVNEARRDLSEYFGGARDSAPTSPAPAPQSPAVESPRQLTDFEQNYIAGSSLTPQEYRAGQVSPKYFGESNPAWNAPLPTNDANFLPSAAPTEELFPRSLPSPEQAWDYNTMRNAPEFENISGPQKMMEMIGADALPRIQQQIQNEGIADPTIVARAMQLTSPAVQTAAAEGIVDPTIAAQTQFVTQLSRSTVDQLPPLDQYRLAETFKIDPAAAVAELRQQIAEKVFMGSLANNPDSSYYKSDEDLIAAIAGSDIFKRSLLSAENQSLVTGDPRVLKAMSEPYTFIEKTTGKEMTLNPSTWGVERMPTPLPPERPNEYYAQRKDGGAVEKALKLAGVKIHRH